LRQVTPAVLQSYFQKAAKLRRLAASFNVQHAAHANYEPVAIKIRA
jgi:hypothetical protein